jgi:hypothetical protein
MPICDNANNGHEASVPYYAFDYQILLYPSLDLLIAFQEALRLAPLRLEREAPIIGKLMVRAWHLNPRH